MPVSFYQKCLHLTFQLYLSIESYSCIDVKLSNIVIQSCMMKNDLIEKAWHANLALFSIPASDKDFIFVFCCC